MSHRRLKIKQIKPQMLPLKLELKVAGQRIELNKSSIMEVYDATDFMDTHASDQEEDDMFENINQDALLISNILDNNLKRIQELQHAVRELEFSLDIHELPRIRHEVDLV